MSGTISVANIESKGTNANNNSTKVLFENFAYFSDCLSKVNNMQVDNAKGIDVVMPMYNLA